MADVWLVKEGTEPTYGAEPYLQIPLPICIARTGLLRSDFLCDLTAPPRFGSPHDLQSFRGPEYVVVEIDMAEADGSGWSPGFYRPAISVAVAKSKLNV
jgi:hypothetical protein